MSEHNRQLGSVAEFCVGFSLQGARHMAEAKPSTSNDARRAAWRGGGPGARPEPTCTTQAPYAMKPREAFDGGRSDVDDDVDSVSRRFPLGGRQAGSA